MSKRGEERALEAFPSGVFISETFLSFCRGTYINGYEQAEKDIIALIESRISEIIGDAQPKPILRTELQELITRIKNED